MGPTEPSRAVPGPRPSHHSPGSPGQLGTSTGALVVELSQLEHAVRSWATRREDDSALDTDADFSSLMLRKHTVLRLLRGRGLTFPEGSFDQPLVQADDGFTSADDVQTLPTTVDVGVDAEEKIKQLEQALASRTVIGQAVGIQMERHGLTADDAFARLRDQSSRSNRKLRDIAAELVGSATDAGVRP